MPCVKNRKAEDCFFGNVPVSSALKKRSPKPQKKAYSPTGRSKKSRRSRLSLKKTTLGKKISLFRELVKSAFPPSRFQDCLSRDFA